MCVVYRKTVELEASKSAVVHQLEQTQEEMASLQEQVDGYVHTLTHIHTRTHTHTHTHTLTQSGLEGGGGGHGSSGGDEEGAGGGSVKTLTARQTLHKVLKVQYVCREGKQLSS